MISPFCTDEELIRGAQLMSNHQVRIMGERLKARCAQLDVVHRLADPQAPDLAARLAEIRAAAARENP